MIAAGDALAQDERGRQNRKRKELVALSIAPTHCTSGHTKYPITIITMAMAVSRPPKDWLKNPDAPAMKREAEEGWGK
jgi:hypothetical protein